MSEALLTIIRTESRATAKRVVLRMARHGGIDPETVQPPDFFDAMAAYLAMGGAMEDVAAVMFGSDEVAAAAIERMERFGAPPAPPSSP